jgi:polyferredoxin
MKILRWVRRASQAAFLLLFLYLLVRSSYPVGSGDGSPLTRAAEPVELFFRLDPLAALLTLLASHRFYVSLIPALGVVLLTLVAGRAFCGWICPLGTLNQLFALLWTPKRQATRIKRNQPSPWQATKYLVLAGSLGCALFGSAAAGWLDPIALLTRGLGLFLLPALDLVADESIAPARSGLAGVADTINGWIGMVASLAGTFRPQRFQAGWLAGLMLLALLAANALQPRLWCRLLCPLGGLLGLIARFSLLGMRKRHEACIECGLCETHCQGADSPRGGRAWRESECVTCLNCAAACPTRVIDFRFFPARDPEPARAAEATGPSRRQVLGSAAAGAALVPLARVGPGLGVADDPRLIRPPGALPERDFRARCLRCGQCMKAIQPALGEGGIEGVFSPVLIMRIGFCEPSCVTCGQVCPTGAIRPLSEPEKLGRGEFEAPLKIGTAFIDRGRCLPWSMSTPCIVCEEFCPARPKAIWVERAEVPLPEGGVLELDRPRVSPGRCTGCGACEFICPVRTPPAIHVTSVGEDRAPANSILLRTSGSEP